jgi:tetratricopeptide (TPR) repeat protein
MNFTRARRVSKVGFFGCSILSCMLLVPTPGPARSAGDYTATHSLAGSYLAGRFARNDHETGRAARFYQNALLQDPDSGILLERAFLMEASEANWYRATDLATEVIKRQPRHRMARLLLGLQSFKEKNFEESIEHFKAAGSGPIGELTSVITRAWVEEARGRTIEALSSLTLRKQADWARFYLRYHRALIADMAGRKNDAKRAFETVFQQDKKTLRTTLAYAQSAAHAGDYRRAKSILREHFRQSSGEPHPLAAELMEKLTKGEPIEPLIATPAQGLAEVFYGLGEALTGEGGVSIGVLYLQMALYLEPRHPFALAALASAYESMKRYDKAIETYAQIPEGSALQLDIDIRKAFNLNQLERVDEAKELLEEVAIKHPESIKPYDALGNIMRARKRFDEAAGYYSKAIDLIGEPKQKDWVYFYSRGTSYERLKKWDLAEADLQKALDLDASQPLTLNYLGYSWIDQNMNLKAGLKLIEKAVSLKPDDGYIVDSLGWAHYRMGHYQDAVQYLERAVELRPDDPVLNDHLGDAYWQVGRIREARFQWDQALSLKPEPELIGPIEKKLAEGLPVKRQALAQPAVSENSATRRNTASSGGERPDEVPLPPHRNAD